MSNNDAAAAAVSAEILIRLFLIRGKIKDERENVVNSGIIRERREFSVLEELE